MCSCVHLEKKEGVGVILHPHVTYTFMEKVILNSIKKHRVHEVNDSFLERCGYKPLVEKNYPDDFIFKCLCIKFIIYTYIDKNRQIIPLNIFHKYHIRQQKIKNIS